MLPFALLAADSGPPAAPAGWKIEVLAQVPLIDDPKWNEKTDETPRLKGPEGKGIPWDWKARHWSLAPIALEAQRGQLEGVRAA